VRDTVADRAAGQQIMLPGLFAVFAAAFARALGALASNAWAGAA